MVREGSVRERQRVRNARRGGSRVASRPEQAHLVVAGKHLDGEPRVLGEAAQLLDRDEPEPVAPDPAADRLALTALLEDRRQGDARGRGIVLGGGDLGNDGAGLRVEAWPFEADPAVEPARSVASGSQTSTTARPPGARWSAIARSAARCAARVGSTSSEFRAMNARPNCGSPGRRVRRCRPRPGSGGPRRHSRGPIACPGEHGRVDVDAGDLVARLGQRDGQPPGPDRELEDRAVGAVGQREVEVEVARVVDEVEVVEACQRGRGRGVGAVERRGVDGQPSQRTRPPSRRLTARALIASSAARLAAAAVVSAWS